MEWLERAEERERVQLEDLRDIAARKVSARIWPIDNRYAAVPAIVGAPF